MKLPHLFNRRDRVPVADLRRTNPVRYGAILIVLIVIAVYFGFTKKVPFTHGYRLNAVFATAQDIAAKSPVRIAGVTVGTVKGIRREGKTAVVTMEISQSGLPIHRDAELKIRPRLFLEGSWFVELKPGTPSSPTLSSGATIGVTQTANPVQIDQVLDALNSDTRSNLQKFLDGYGEALSSKPSTAEEAEEEPSTRGLTGAEALNSAERNGPEALRGGAIVSQAVGGVEQHDLSKLISGLRRVTAGLNEHEQALGEWVEHFDTFLEELADEASSLKASVKQLPSALRSTSAALAALKRAAPSIRDFAKEITPGVRQTHSTIAAALPWIKKLETLLTPEELGGVAKGLGEAAPSLAGLTGGQKAFFTQSDLFSKCLTKVFFPAGDERIEDGKATSGALAYQEFFYALVGLDGIGQNFDGNGVFSRFLAGGSGHLLVSKETSIVGIENSKGKKLISKSTLQPEGTSPKFPSKEPPYEPLVACDTQTPSNVNSSSLAHGEADGSGG